MKTKEYRTAGMEGEDSAMPDGASLEVTEVKPGLHEKAEGIQHRPLYRLCWPRPSRPALGPLRRLVGPTCSGTYVKLTPERISLDEEAARRYQDASADPATDETTVFLRTQLGNSRLELILASRHDDQWSALHRWTDSWRGLGISRSDIVS